MVLLIDCFVPLARSIWLHTLNIKICAGLSYSNTNLFMTILEITKTWVCCWGNWESAVHGASIDRRNYKRLSISSLSKKRRESTSCTNPLGYANTRITQKWQQCWRKLIQVTNKEMNVKNRGSQWKWRTNWWNWNWEQNWFLSHASKTNNCNTLAHWSLCLEKGVLQKQDTNFVNFNR